MNDTLTVALWAENLACPVRSMKEWADVVDSKMTEAKNAGAKVFLAPEFSAEQWLHFKPENLAYTKQPEWLSQQVEEALALLKPLAKKHDMLLVPGTFPSSYIEGKPPISNRAHIIFPDGKILQQNKLCLTPKEKNPEGWFLSPGNDLQVFEWQGWKVLVLICLDIELPALSAKIAQEKIDVILVPSMTKKLAGYHRVFDCAKARAVELQAAICAVGTVACAPSRDPNLGGASVFIPCEEKFGHTGILAHLPPAYTAEGMGSILTATIPLSDIRAMRQGQAEVWPGAWTSEHVTICKAG